jgi:DUF971 family protein
MSSTKKPKPLNINLDQRLRMLSIEFDDGKNFNLSCEFLRVNSPSAEVQGHGPGEGTLQIGKEEVNIDAIEPVGQYAIALRFDDGHDSGIYSWETLYRMGENQDILWNDYLARLKDAGIERKEVIN